MIYVETLTSETRLLDFVILFVQLLLVFLNIIRLNFLVV